jgi:hypothetical protein
MHAQTIKGYGNLNEYRATFDSLAEFVDHAKNTNKPVWSNRSSREESHKGDDGKWHHGTQTWKEALALADTGWTGADERIKTLGAALAEGVASLIERPFWSLDVTGDALDVGLYLSGEPECWRTLEWKITEGYGRRIFRLIVPTGALMYVGADAYTWAGAAACAAVEAIERAGHGAEVWAYNAADMGLFRLAARVLIKPAEYPLDMPRLAFATANAAFHRRLCFSFRETAPEAYAKPFEYSYGKTSYHYLTESETDPNDIVLPTPAAVDEYARAGGAQAGLLAWLKQRLTQAGVLKTEETAA